MKQKIHVGSRKHLAPEEIQHLESDVNYTLIFLTNGKKFLSSTTLKTLETRLSGYKNFVRINRQIIINQDIITVNNDLTMALNEDKKVKFSRRKAQVYLLNTQNT